MNWQEIISANRKSIVIIGITIGVLIIILIALICTKGALEAADRPQTVTPAEPTPAAVSDLDINNYVKELHSVINNKYNDKLQGYEIATGELLEDGSWYITTIQKPLKDQWSPAQDKYRIILHQVEGKWQIVTEPDLIFAYADYPDIPRGVIYDANNL